MNELANTFSLLNLDVADSQEDTAVVSKENGEDSMEDVEKKF